LNATGAGNPILMDYTVNPVTYSYSSGPSLSSAGNYGKFTTNASGSFTGAFGYVNTANARFTPGNVIYPTIAVGLDIASPTVINRFALNEGITILGFATTSTANDGSFIQGSSAALPGNVVGLWKSVDGNLVTTRPLSMTLVEKVTFGGAPFANTLIAEYDSANGAWNTIIPNLNPEGVRLIQQFDIRTGAVLGCNSDADGTWPSGVVTSNPTNGVVPIEVTLTDAPLNGGACFGIIVVPVKLNSFAVQKQNTSARITWSTESEINSSMFIVERSKDGVNWITVGSVAAAGNSTITRQYSMIDPAPSRGINYYRLKTIDIDSRTSNSDIRSLLFGTSTTVLITPNPASSFIKVFMDKNANTVSQIIISDVNGKIMDKYSTIETQKTITTSGFAKGLYVVKVITGENVVSQKIVIQ